MKKKRKVRPPHSEETIQKMKDAHRKRMVLEEKEHQAEAVRLVNRDVLEEAVDWASGK